MSFSPLKFSGFISVFEEEVFSKKYFNDLEEVVIQSYPEIDKIKKRLCEEGAKNAIMSGSGSSVWADVENELAGKAIKDMMTSTNHQAYLVHSVPHGRKNLGAQMVCCPFRWLSR